LIELSKLEQEISDLEDKSTTSRDSELDQDANLDQDQPDEMDQHDGHENVLKMSKVEVEESVDLKPNSKFSTLKRKHGHRRKKLNAAEKMVLLDSGDETWL
jgi:hypothetical protein